MNPTTHRTRSSNRRLLLFFVVLAGAVGGAAGLFGGGLIAAATCDWNVKEAGCLEDAAYGAVIGGSILIPVGVVVGSWRRARFPTFLFAFLAVGAIAAAGLPAAFVTGQEWIFTAIPFAQLIASAVIIWSRLERATSTRR